MKWLDEEYDTWASIVAAQLKQDPGRWAIVVEDSNPFSASGPQIDLKGYGIETKVRYRRGTFFKCDILARAPEPGQPDVNKLTMGNYPN